MLVLVERRLVDRGVLKLVQLQCGSQVLSPAQDADRAPLATLPDRDWIDQFDGRRSPLGTWLTDALARPPAGNLVVIVWGAWTEELAALLSYLGRQRPTFNVRRVTMLETPVAATVLGAAAAECLGTTDGKACKDALIVFGHEDMRFQAVDEARRMEGLRAAMLATLCREDEGGRESVVLGREGIRVTGSWWGGRDVADLQALIRALAVLELRERLRDSTYSPGFGEVDLAAAVSALWGNLADIGAPFDRTPGQEHRRFSDDFKDIPSEAWSGWRCPLTRESALAEGGEFIATVFGTAEGYAAELRRQLGPIATQIRLNSSRVYRMSREEVRGKIGNARHLVDIVSARKNYLTQIARDQQPSRNEPLRPCEPADFPAREERRAMFVTKPTIELQTLACRLPRRWPTVGIYTLSVVLTVLGGFGAFRGWPKALDGVCGGVGIALGIGLSIVSRFRARRVSRELRRLLEDAFVSLRKGFQDKADWCASKVTRTTGFQLAALGRSLNARLGEEFDRVFYRWDSGAQADRLSLNTQAVDAGLTGEDLEEIGPWLGDLTQVIVGRAIGAQRGGEAGAVLEPLSPETLLESKLNELYRKASLTPVPELRVEDQLLEIAGARLQPPLLARLDDVGTRIIGREMFLPSTYSEALVEKLLRESAPTETGLSVVRTQVSGPLVVSSTGPLPLDVAIRALEEQRVTD
jgi:hypothetical protein